jgi:hypothetical protein
VTSPGTPVASAFLGRRSSQSEGGRRNEDPGVSRTPFVWALVYVALFALVFFKISWSLGDTYSHLAGAALSSWQEAFVDAFTARGREYRPFITLRNNNP